MEKPLGLKLKAAKGPNGGLTVEVSTQMSSLLPAFCAPIPNGVVSCRAPPSMLLQQEQVSEALCKGTAQADVHALSLLHLQNASGNAAKAGIKSGDTVIYTSSFFGDELWPSDKLGFTRSALANAPSPVRLPLLCKLPHLQWVQHAVSPSQCTWLW